MKTKSQQRQTNAFTIWELLIIVFLVVVVTGLLLPCLAPRPRKPTRITCVNNLKQIGLALRMWSGDHHEKFPMMVSTNQAGSLEWSEIGQAFRHFQAVSNELNSPKVLACAADKQRSPATTFAALTNKNLSYFLGLDANETQPQSILSGDRNASPNSELCSGLLLLTSNSPVVWTKHIHPYCGNIGLGDGSVQQASTTNLQDRLRKSPTLPVRFELP